MSEISAIWERIEAWYEAQGGLHLLKVSASAEVIADARLSRMFLKEMEDDQTNIV